jgi:hypothetical protein
LLWALWITYYYLNKGLLTIIYAVYGGSTTITTPAIVSNFVPGLGGATPKPMYNNDTTQYINDNAAVDNTSVTVVSFQVVAGAQLLWGSQTTPTSPTQADLFVYGLVDNLALI